jgi:hypothetical protein
MVFSQSNDFSARNRDRPCPQVKNRGPGYFHPLHAWVLAGILLRQADSAAVGENNLRPGRVSLRAQMFEALARERPWLPSGNDNRKRE